MVRFLVRHDDVARVVHSHAVRVVEVCARAFAVRKAWVASPSNHVKVDRIVHRAFDPPDAVAVRFSNNHMVVIVDGNTVWPVELGRQCADHVGGRVDHTDAAVGGVGD